MAFHANTFRGRTVDPLDYAIGLQGIRNGDEPATINKNVFLGLNVGVIGPEILISTTNVKTSADKTVFNILAGSVFTKGLELVNTAQPALAPLSTLVEGVYKQLRDRHNGVPVQSNITLGLDFGEGAGPIHLRQGTYIVLQIPPDPAAQWKWTDWEWLAGRIRSKADENMTPKYNYIMFGVSKYEESSDTKS